MTGYELPTSIDVGGSPMGIRSDYRAIIDVLIAINDPNLDDQSKAYILLKIIYVDFDKIPSSMIDEAYTKACQFIDANNICGGCDYSDDKIMDWERDAQLICSAVNSVSGSEIRDVPYCHWWTFIGYYINIGDSLFSSVVRIRSKLSRREKLDKQELEFYKNNKSLIILPDKNDKMDDDTNFWTNIMDNNQHISVS